MPLSNKDRFLKEVLSCVKFPFDRNDIKLELECQISDKIDYYVLKGYDKETAESQAINDMGDAKEIGLKFNKQHNPFIGWLWKITNFLLVISVIINIYFVGIPLLMSLFTDNPIKDIPKSDIVYKIDLNEKVKIDDTVIHFTNIIYDKNGDMSIFYKYYDTRLWGRGWSVGYIGEISDNLGNSYQRISGHGGGGIVSKERCTVHDFSKEADTLIITYDNYNRKYKVEIPLKAGDKNE